MSQLRRRNSIHMWNGWRWVVRGNVKHTSWVVLALFPGPPRFIGLRSGKRKSVINMYYTERKPKNKNEGGLGMRLGLYWKY